MFAVAALVGVSVSAGSPELRLEPISLPAAGASAPKLALVPAADDASWREGRPIWEAKKGEVGAKLWLATTRDALLLHVVVEDPKQSNSYHERNLWLGDCLYVSIDARGDTTAEQLAHDTFEPDDATYLFGLGDRGPEGRVIAHGNPHRLMQSATSMIRSLVRDEAAKTTTYDLEVPWSDLGTAHGQSPTMGLALDVAHKNAAGEQLPWGRTSAGPQGPRELNVLALDPGDAPFASIAAKQTRVLRDGQQAEVTVALRTPANARLVAKVGNATQSMDVRPSSDVQRFCVRVPVAGLELASGVLHVSVESELKEVAAMQSFPVSTPALAMARLDERVEKLLASASNDVVRDHLTSTRIVVRSCFEKLALDRALKADADDQFMNITEMILDRLPQDRFDFEDHVSRGLPFVFAFTSDRDYSLQFAALQFPYGWQPDRAYPLTVYLHGACADQPISGLSTAFDNSGQDTLYDYAKLDPADVPPLHRGFLLAPWARGTSGYMNAAEDDVWQTIRLVKGRFKIDEDRQYMTGFSMGCAGALRLAAQTPDRWAGVGLASGLRAGPNALLDNVARLPIMLWAGELDGASEGARSFAEQCKAKGVTYNLRIAPNLPHTYPYAEYKAGVAYLMQFTRPKRPDSFSFAATGSSSSPAGIYGITMRGPSFARRVGMESGPAASPRFTCQVAGDTVRIESQNTAGLHIVLGEGGLGLSGNVKVVWNGQPAYEGSAGTIDLAEQPGQRGARGQ
jgi:hypothetical protein